MSLRLKLLLAASLLLAVPLAGWRFVLDLETYLRQRQGESAADAARTLALAVESRPELLPAPRAAAEPDDDLYVHPLADAPQVDGYDRDWGELAFPHGAGTPAARAGWHGDWLFLLLTVPRAGAPGPLRLVLEDSPGFRRAWLLEATTPGEVVALEVPPAPGTTAPGHRDGRLQAATWHGAGASVVEIRLPLAMRAPRLGFEVLDRAAPGGVAARVPAVGAWSLVLPPPRLAALLRSLAPTQGRRIRITDSGGRVLAQAGSLAAGSDTGGLAAALQGLLAVDDESLLSLAPESLRLDGPELSAALSGRPGRRLRRADPGGPLVVSAAHPLWARGELAGALVLEESTSPIQSLGRRALLELVGAGAAAFLAGSALLLVVAGRAAARLRDLRDQAVGAVDASGRVRGRFQPPGGGDEIGDLGRSFAAAVTRLEGYQDYLEQLARRLSHELRTPLAVIRTSLDNLALRNGDAAASDPLLVRAQQGVERLDGLIRRMSEAARLEQAMADSERTPIDLSALLNAAIAGHRAALAPLQLAARLPPEPVWITGSAELLLQALDKLLANARDFAAPDTPVTVILDRAGPLLHLAVENLGPPLPQGDTARLFDSMVSRRGARTGAEPHLGLGLYVVRLVAEFHGGRPLAQDRDGGVRVGMVLPAGPAPRPRES